MKRVFLFLYRLIKIFVFKLEYKKNFVFGKNLRFRDSFRVNISPEGYLKIGDNCFFNHDCSINVHKKIVIGSLCIIGENVKMYDHNHVFKNTNLNIVEQGFSEDEIIVGNNCWIGSNVTILKGVHIGDNCVIGAGCTIAKDILSNTLVRLDNNYKIEEIKRWNKE